MNYSRCFLLIVFPLFLLNSCVVEKRRYRDGFYHKKINKPKNEPVAASDPPPVDPQEKKPDHSNAEPQQQNSPPEKNKENSPWNTRRLPHNYIYGSTGEGICKIGLNYERDLYFSKYFLLFGHAGIGLTDAVTNEYMRRGYFSAGFAVGHPHINLSAETGWTTEIKSGNWTQYYGAYLRITPGRKSVYVKTGVWRTKDPAQRNSELNLTASVGVGF